MKKYLSLEYGTGRIFEYSKEEKPGFEKYSTKDGNISYRNYYLKGVRGVYKGLKIEEGNFGEQVKIGLEDNGTTFIVCMNTKSGSYYDNDFFVPFIQYLKNMELGETYLMQPYRFTPKGEKYEKTGVSIKDENNNPLERGTSLAYYKGKGKDRELVDGDIPPLEFKQKKSGKWELDKVAAAKRDEVIDNLVEEAEEEHKADFSSGIEGYNVTSADYASKGGNNTPQSTEAPVKEEAVVEQEVESEVEDDDLPF